MIFFTVALFSASLSGFSLYEYVLKKHNPFKFFFLDAMVAHDERLARKKSSELEGTQVRKEEESNSTPT